MSVSSAGHPVSLNRPLVSVVIPTLNRAKFLNAALASVAAQDMSDQVETIVVNDGGRSVARVVRARDDGLAVRLVELDRCRGPAAARNIGIDLAEGQYIAFLDDDDLFMPDHLAAGCEPLERDEADLVYLSAIVADRRLDELPADLSTFPLKAHPYDCRILQVANFLHTGSVIVQNFRDTPVRFDESLDVCEDWDLWIGLTTVLGCRVRFVDKVTSVYHQLPDVPGLVAGAQLVSPSKFALARGYLHAKWPSGDPLVVAYRAWMEGLEQFRSDLIAKQHRMPNLLFDDILGYLHDRMSREEPADFSDIGRFFVRA